MTTSEKLELVRRYYDACSAGDVEELRAALDDDVVHYFLAPNPGSAPVSGAENLSLYWRKVQRRIAGRWVVDRIVGEGDEAVIEWTLFWSPPGGQRVVTRGSEWYRFSGTRIAEIRAYYQQLDQTSELDGFDYDARSYSTLTSEVSALHPG